MAVCFTSIPLLSKLKPRPRRLGVPQLSQRTASPNGGTSANLVAIVPAGRMFLHVSGVGDPTVPYSDYGSLGQYALSGAIPVSGPNMIPPMPNPVTFESAPTPINSSTITMRAATAIDDAGSAVQYRFECVVGAAGCLTSAWQSERDYTVANLAGGRQLVPV